jgi:hypothetical protein
LQERKDFAGTPPAFALERSLVRLGRRKECRNWKATEPGEQTTSSFECSGENLGTTQYFFVVIALLVVVLAWMMLMGNSD